MVRAFQKRHREAQKEVKRLEALVRLTGPPGSSPPVVAPSGRA